VITINNLCYKIDKRNIIDHISYTFHERSFYGLIGANGTGKSTLIQLIGGIIKPLSGEIIIDGKQIVDYSKKQLAQKIAVLQQGGLEPLNYTVNEVLEMARYPYQGWLGQEKQNSEPIIKEAIKRTNITKLKTKKLSELSGGERQRVALAKLWVQRPKVLLLDEPTTYLDIGYQQMIMEFIANWQKEEQLLVIAVMHDINLAALYCDHIVALHEGSFIADGKTEKMLTQSLLNKLFDANIAIVDHPKLHVPQMIMNPESK